jgi:hypothetical protein
MFRTLAIRVLIALEEFWQTREAGFEKAGLFSIA